MKLGMFRDAQSLAEWHRREADAIEANGLRQAKEALAKARVDGCAAFFNMNPWIAEEHKAAEAEKHLKWLEGQVKYLEGRVRKHRREAEKALAGSAVKGA